MEGLSIGMALLSKPACFLSSEVGLSTSRVGSYASLRPLTLPFLIMAGVGRLWGDADGLTNTRDRQGYQGGNTATATENPRQLIQTGKKGNHYLLLWHHPLQ